MKTCFPYRTRGSCILGSYCDESDRNGMLLARQVILMSMLMIYFVKVPGDCHGGRATWSVPGRVADKPGMPPCSDRAAPRQLSGGALLCFALRLLRCACERPRAALPPQHGVVVVVVPVRRRCHPTSGSLHGAGKEWRAPGSPVHAVINVSIWLKLRLKGVRYGAFGRGDLLVSGIEIELASSTGTPCNWERLLQRADADN
jgi:hypothetical protein